MLKFLLVLGVLFLALALAAYLALVHYLDVLVVNGVNRYGPQLTQAKVELAGAHLSPFTGSGTLTGLSVGNPAGWSEGRAFYLGKVQVDMEPLSVFRDHIVINELVIDRPEFTYETNIVSSNIKELLKKIEGAPGSGGGGRESAATPAAGSARKFVVKKFRLTNGKATMGLGANAVIVTLPPISLDNVGVAEGGITATQLSGVLMSQVLGSVVAGATGASGQPGALNVEQLKAAAKNAGDALKKMFKTK